MPRRKRAPALALATRNRGKVLEFSALFASFGLEVFGLDHFTGLADVEESGASFMENARLKAAGVCAATGLVTVADDSGLMVDALNGRPGIYSARFWELEKGGGGALSGGDFIERSERDRRNNALLTELLRGLPPEKLTARFCCALAAQAPGGAGIGVEGRWEGLILHEPRGENGFGYDPLFFDPEAGLSAAEMSLSLKNERSHRARAARKLLALWPSFLDRAGLR
ncbi:MAG: non-canonical purine NTP pyrophosphatase [Deltaproteobacteria bacterium]|jgi:XTP/dITP diphosphohydrolase|nr:non-canonical purine NTP pyrophosphatase [Deltaproteobacteria bacterium]